MPWITCCMQFAYLNYQKKHEMVANKWTKNVFKWVIHLLENISWRNIITLRYSIQIVTYLFYLPENISWRNIRTLPYSRKVNLKNVASNELHLVATFHRKSRNEFAMKASILMILINNLIKKIVWRANTRFSYDLIWFC